MKPSRKRALIVWLAAIAAIFVAAQTDHFARQLGFRIPGLGVFQFLAWTLVIALSLYLFAVSVGYVLRSLFWRVGRRLALSYFLIGMLPFLFFAVIILVAGYLIAGVLSQAEFRDERNSMMNRLEQWNLEYALTGATPPTALPSLEIYDTQADSGAKLPNWLKRTSFVGLAERGGQALFVSSRVYQIDGRARTVVFVQPMDDVYAKNLEDKNGMIISPSLRAQETEGGGIRIGTTSKPKASVSIGTTTTGTTTGTTTTSETTATTGTTTTSGTTATTAATTTAETTTSADPATEADEENTDWNIDDKTLGSFLNRTKVRRGVIWGDPTPPLTRWENGRTTDRAFILLSNPWKNLLEFYFGSSEYVQAIVGIIAGIGSLLAVVYLLAVMLAAGLIFSITRAVNRIEKGTKAVERGDFSYRIGLKPRNQLGEVATSFDRMTASVSTLLTKVAGQERLQSEIDIAASIQRNLLPKEGPRFRGISFSAHFEPTASIGGDYYDVFNLDERRLAVAIGDVSGHGLSTGLVMAMVKAAITTLVEGGVDEESLFLRLNDLVHRSTEKRAFMTLAFTIFDLDGMTIRHTNAGHLYPYLLRKGAPPTAIEVSSWPLGVRSDFEPRTVELQLQEGDTFVYLSDGIVEAQDPNGNPFGFDRLEKILGSLHDVSPASVQTAILTQVASHSGDRPADDDRTVMVLRFDQIDSRSRPYVEAELAPAVQKV